MKILVINAGSSSLKFQLLEISGKDRHKHFKVLYKGFIDRLDKIRGKKNKQVYKKALHLAFAMLLKKKIIPTLQSIDAIGHRVVHGGEKYRKATIINAQVIKDIKKICTLAPLHNPPNLAAIIACQKILRQIPQVAVFDTGFHQTIPQKAYLYGLPFAYYQKMRIRRYGFHGTSHAYVARETIKMLQKKNSKIITCHLGNGSSITAIENGKSIDTSMGFTPLEGVPMGTRSGDIDPAIIFHLMKIHKLSSQKIETMLNHESGLKGISEMSSDVRDLWTKKNTEKSKRTFEFLAYRIAKYIGAYTAGLNGLDAITFTGGIGENADYIRQDICNYLSYLGLQLDSSKNKKNALEISSAGSKIKVYIIPTNEEKQIAKETYQLIISSHS